MIQDAPEKFAATLPVDLVDSSVASEKASDQIERGVNFANPLFAPI